MSSESQDSAARVPSFGKIALRGAMVTGGGQAVKIGLSLVSVVVLGRLLQPEDFGLIASVSPILALVAMFQELGLREALIQRADLSNSDINQVFWVAIAASIVCSLVIAALAPAVAAFYEQPRLQAVVLVLALPFFLGGMIMVPTGLLARHLQFGKLAGIEVLGAFTNLVTAIIGAVVGLGYWSLVLGGVTSALVVCIAYWSVVGWSPGRPSFRIQREIVSFSANLSGFRLVNYFSRNADNVLLGKFAGPVALGYYDRAYRLLLFPLQSINYPLSQVIIPLLSKLRGDVPRLRHAYLRVVGIPALAAIPAIAAVTINAEETIVLVFGDKWLPSAAIFSWLGVAGIAQFVASTGGWIFISQGETGRMFRLNIVFSLLLIVAFVASLPWGAVGMAAAYTIVNVAFLPCRWWYISRLGIVSFRDLFILQAPYFAASGITWGIVSLLKSEVSMPDIAAIGITVVISYAVSVALVLLTRPGRETVREIVSILSGLVRSPKVAG
ncbi:lipopolysaccharide biosynthesis protein [Pseudoroseicyclus tamaricis]|uniref:Lipopolysaccharide biosynthesis protein n=1 Tax=Pseudoroseicyclus tamaricis TaxID=2705421 RepID=A0A6B2K0Y4_9RHOB|nr:lipopolysaccharide biosynthesis protein [Pseudoroseicyclus tamaricis]NDV01352.1 lipopolysaccharide biosynthesis protein [Pseudoroseicyclus tamaricis]